MWCLQIEKTLLDVLAVLEPSSRQNRLVRLIHGFGSFQLSIDT